ncbi:MAG: DNA polymerase III subunit alpha [Treponema sp.]|jgi:DNA polymerase-3 subunit alpha|nr:DNA polymerase III subunit alpha [Treponema sp.]
MSDFVHLHVHSDFSLQDAAVSVTSLCDRAEELGMEYLALTDHGNMFGAMDFLAACKKNDKGEPRARPIKPIIGCEVYVAPGSRFEKKGAESENKYYHFILLAETREGYFNLVKLCSRAYTEGFYYRPRIDDELLAEYHRGLIALSACVSGEIPRLIQAGKPEEAEVRALFYQSLFGEGNFYLEIQDHGIPAAGLRNSSLSQRDINQVIAGISARTGIPLVATNDVHYLKREDAPAHDVLLCIGTARLRSDERRKRYYGDQFYFKTGEEMAALFSDYPEAITNTFSIARRCNPEVPEIAVKELTHYLPDFEIPPGFANADDYLRHLTMEGLPKRYPGMEQKVLEQVEYELDVIITMGFTGYFLIVADFITWAKDHGISVGPGRGSGAGSLVAYALQITNIDPLKYGLLFERFLNPQRISMPDFDIDFCNAGRDDVIQYVTEKYGKERVGQIITFGTLGAKQVIKDVARVLDISIAESEMITKLIPKDPKITLSKAIDASPQLGELEKDPKYRELFTLARKLEGLNRHSSIHAAGIVIGKSALDNYVPLYRDPKTGGIATQYTMGFLEQCGLVKMDFLGLKTLDVLKRTGELIRARGGAFADFDIEKIPETDEATFKMLGEGKSFEVFQFESEGMQNTLRQARPGRIEDLIALNALFRPGPIDNIPKFIESKRNPQLIRYPDPSLEDILRETYGVIVYQEQVMQVARIVAGYSMGKADLLRRAMGKKKKAIIDAEKTPFLEGALKQGYSLGRAGAIYDLMVPFADYGFNKSHAAAYSVLAYQTAYLKANFPAEFMAANLSNEIYSTDKDKLSACIDETRKMGIALDPPDINRSGKLFSVVEGRIVYGFLGIKGIGDRSAEEIVLCRREGPYRDFIDFLKRVDIKTIGKKNMELLIQTGAFDTMGRSREVLLGNLERAIEQIQNIKDEAKYGQSSLFGDTEEKLYPDFVFDEFPNTSREEKLRIEKELTGFYLSGHPMDDCRTLWERYVGLDLGQAESIAPGPCILIGIFKGLRAITSKSGRPMAFATLADYRGEIDLVFFEDSWVRCRDRIKENDIIVLRGKVDTKRGKPAVQVEAVLEADKLKIPELVENFCVQPLDKYRETWRKLVKLDLADPAKAAEGEYTLVGTITNLRPIQDKNGKAMAFGSLQDYRGEMDLVFFGKTWESCQGKLAEGKPAALKGRLDTSREKPNLKVSAVLDLERLEKKAEKMAESTTETQTDNGSFGTSRELPERSAADQPAADRTTVDRTVMNRPVDRAAVDRMVDLATADRPVTSQTPDAAVSGPERSWRELHILLDSAIARLDEDLLPLRDGLVENPGPCQVFIHVPQGANERETVIRTASQISASAAPAAINALKRCRAVADVWGE